LTLLAETWEALGIVVVLILVLVWVAALLPIALKKRSDWDLFTSITRFRQHRRTLVRMSPWADDRLNDSSGRPAPTNVTRAFAGRRPGDVDRAARERLKALRERRRRILTRLVATFLASLFLGAVPALRPLWYIALMAGIATGAYVAALVYFRRLDELAVERDRKVVELATRARQSAVAPVRSRPSFVIVEATS